MWLPRLNPDFIEVRAFIASQANGRGAPREVFRKRALTTDGPDAGESAERDGAEHLRDADSFSEMSVALHLVAEATC